MGHLFSERLESSSDPLVIQSPSGTSSDPELLVKSSDSSSFMTIGMCCLSVLIGLSKASGLFPWQTIPDQGCFPSCFPSSRVSWFWLIFLQNCLLIHDLVFCHCLSTFFACLSLLTFASSYSWLWHEIMASSFIRLGIHRRKQDRDSIPSLHCQGF